MSSTKSFGALVGLVCRSSLPAGLRHTLIGLLSCLDDAEGETSIGAIAESSGRSVNTTRGDVAELERRGIVRRSGALGVAWRYEVDEGAVKALRRGATPTVSVTPHKSMTPHEIVRGTPHETMSTPLTKVGGVPSRNHEGSTCNKIPDARARSCPSSDLETPSLARESTTPGPVTPADMAPMSFDLVELEQTVLECMRPGNRRGSMMLAPGELRQLEALVKQHGAAVVRDTLEAKCAGTDRPIAMLAKVLGDPHRMPSRAPAAVAPPDPVYGQAKPGHVWVGGVEVAEQYADQFRDRAERRRNPPVISAAVMAEFDALTASLCGPVEASA